MTMLNVMLSQYSNGIERVTHLLELGTGTSSVTKRSAQHVEMLHPSEACVLH